ASAQSKSTVPDDAGFAGRAFWKVPICWLEVSAGGRGLSLECFWSTNAVQARRRGGAAAFQKFSLFSIITLDMGHASNYNSMIDRTGQFLAHQKAGVTRGSLLSHSSKV